MAKPKQKAPKKDKSSGFMTAHEVAKVAADLIAQEDQFRPISAVKVLYVYCRKPITERGEYVPCQVGKLGGINAYLAAPEGPDAEFVPPTPQYLVKVHRDAFLLMPDKAKEAMVFGCLCRMNVETLDSGGKRLKLQKPDIETFTDVVAKYGQTWLPAGLMKEAVSGQPPLMVVDNEKPQAESSGRKAKGAIHDRDYQEARL